MKGELCLEENIGVSKCVLVAPLGGHFRSYFRIFRFQKNKEFDFFKGDLSMKLEKDFFPLEDLRIHKANVSIFEFHLKFHNFFSRS